MESQRALIFSLPEYAYLHDILCAGGDYESGRVDRRSFPDGERYQRIQTPVDGRDCFLLGGTISDAATLSLYDLACGLVSCGARRLTLVIPYFGYSTMERVTQPGEVVVAKTRARLLSAVPPASYGNRVILLDLHSEGIPHYFDAGLTAFHAYAKPVVNELARQLAGNDDFVLASTDAGRAKWVQSLANDLGVEPAFVFKQRLDDSTTQVTAVSARVRDRTVIIYDDMVRSGGSLVGAARAYADAGAARIAVVATHGVFVDNALERLHASGLFSQIACTDSHPRAHAAAGPRLVVAS